MSAPTVQIEVVSAPSVILVEVGDATLVVDDSPSVALELTLPGIQGPAGPTGPVGPQGPVGPAGAAREVPYDFAIPLQVWEVTHDLPITPSVHTYDTGGNPIEGDVTYPTPTTVRVTWAFPMAGRLVITT